MVAKVLGTGCPKCHLLESRLKEVASKNNIACEIQKVTDLSQIARYGVMMTPALVIGEQVKSAGAIPSETQLLQWLCEA